MRVISVVGARPQFVKLAPMATAFRGVTEHIIVHTGQHYDANMSDVFFSGLNIPKPDISLNVGSGKHGEQTGQMLSGLEDVLESENPDWVLVYGDTNSTLAAAIASAKLNIPLAHLEAGLRSRNMRMPEELNRILTDHASDLLLAPTDLAMKNLAGEGLAGRSVQVGDVMTDVLHSVQDQVTVGGLTSRKYQELYSRGYYVCTLHRPQNTDDAHRLRAIIQALGALDKTVVLLAHPRLVSAARKIGLSLSQGRIVVEPPLGYSELVAAVMHSDAVITDSGGLQKEAFLLRVPCTTIRTETEWSETVDLGWNSLLHNLDDLSNTVGRPTPKPTDLEPYGDGRAAQKVVRALIDGNDSC